MENKITISRNDQLKLRALLSGPTLRALVERDDLADLLDELDRAAIVPAEQMPADVIGLGSVVHVHDLTNNSELTYTLVLPHEADVASGRISVLAPLGTALLGARVDDRVEWQMPGGARSLHIRSVERPAALLFDPENAAPVRAA